MSTRRRVETILWDKLKLDEGWFNLFALLLAFMSVVWSIEGAKLVDGGYLLPRLGLLGFLVGFGLAKTRFIPAMLGHSFMVSVGMVLVGLMVGPFGDPLYKEDWSKQLGNTVLRVVRWCENAIAGNARDDNLVYLTLLTFGVWLMGYMSAWLLFRGHRVWWTVALLGTVLMINLSFNPPNALMSFSFFLVVSLLLVVRFSAYMDEQRWRSLRLYFQPGIWRGAMMVGGALALVVMAVAFATPSASQVDSLGQVLDKISQPFNGIKGFWDQVGSSGDAAKDKLIGRSKANYNSLDDSFTLGGPLRLSNDPFFRVTGDSNVPLSYLQAKTMDEYDGKGWLSSYQTGADGKIPENTPFRRLSLAASQALPTSTDQGRATGRLTLTALVPGFNPVMTLGDLVSLDKPSLVAFHYEKTTINTALNSFKLKDIPDGSGSKRSVLVDDTTGKVVPPALLDLVKYLKDGSKLDDLAFPTTLTASYIKRGSSWSIQYRLGNGRSVPVQLKPDGSVTLDLQGWFYALPSPTDLQALSLQPGSNAYTAKLPKVAVKNDAALDKNVEVNTSVYLSSAGDYVLTLESPMAAGNTALDRFRATESGKLADAEIKKLQDAVKGNKVSYTLANGKPVSLQYEGYEPNYDDLTGAVLIQPLGVGESYTTYARRYRADVLSLRQSTAQYPDWIKNRYLKLPKNFSPGIKGLAEELTAGATTPYDKTVALTNYLRSLNYSDNPPPAPEGRDEVDYFLFDSKSGYCTYFASALTLMTRSLGIPSRMATGFVGGEFDATSNSWIVRGTAAHAWTQVYFPGMGWVDFESTPNQSDIQRPTDPSAVPPTPAATPTPAGQTAPNTSENQSKNPEPTKTPAANGDPAAPTATATQPEQPKEFPLWVLVVVVLALAGVGAYQARRVYLKRQFALPDPSPLVVYNRMSQSARKAGLRGRSGMTPYEYAGYLGRQLPNVEPQIESITQAYVRRRYGPAEAERLEEPALTMVGAMVSQASAPNEAPLLSELDAPTLKVEPDTNQMRQQWETYQTAVLRYRRDRRLERITPAPLRRRKKEGQ